MERSVEPQDGGPVTVRCWGVRGSIPTPGPDTSRFGGNTSCVEVKSGSQRLIFDAGSGLRLLGGELALEGVTARARIFLTHFHWDHIQGFPFFGPLYDPAVRLEIVGPEQDEIDIRTLFASQMGPVYFPVPFAAVAARTSFEHLNDGGWRADGFDVSALRMRHPSFTLGYRVRAGGRTVCYIPDNELEGGSYAVDGDGWERRLDELIKGADLLIHDAMYTDEEYADKPGWGHSTFEQAYELAARNGVRRLLFFHHAPERSDTELERIVEVYRARSRQDGGPQVDAAREGPVLTLGEE